MRLSDSCWFIFQCVRDKVSQSVSHLHAFAYCPYRVRTVPYINGRIAAPSSLAWTSGAAVPYACGRNAGLVGQKCEMSNLGACTYFEEFCER
jgi:hypothetical protein